MKLGPLFQQVLQKGDTMKKRLTSLLLIALTAISLMTIPASAAVTAHFTDVPSSHWAFPYVERAYQDGAIAGTGGDPGKGTGTFSPGTELTYGQFFTILTRAFYPEEVARAQTLGGPWYAPALQVAQDHGLTYFSEETLQRRAEHPIDRYNASYVIVKLMKDIGIPFPSAQEREQAAARIGDWAAVQAEDDAWPYYVSAAYAAGILSGVDEDGTFAGKGTIYRDSAAVIYTRLAERQETAQGDLQQEHQIVYGEGWELIPDPAYRKALEDEFYETYPRVLARWAMGRAIQKTVPIAVEKDLGSAFMQTAYVELDEKTGIWERRIDIDASNQDTEPSWAFTHELTHIVQNYGYLQSAWWTECLADYGKFRYYVWTDMDRVVLDSYYRQGDPAQRDWYFEAYGGEWFFAYMDSRYPTTSKGFGLIDSIHNAIIAGEIANDDPSDPAFNAVVRRVTGYDTIKDLHQQYIKELDAGTWTFNGFKDYADNYITEGLPGVADPIYPSNGDFDLCAGAYTYGVSGAMSAETAGNSLVDGDRSTKWQAGPKDLKDQNRHHELGITLSKPMTFDTYTLYHEGSQGDSRENTRAWRLMYYDDETKEWVQFDEVWDNTQDVTTRTFPPVTTQNLWLRVLDPSGTGDETVRLYELELYDKR